MILGGFGSAGVSVTTPSLIVLQLIIASSAVTSTAIRNVAMPRFYRRSGTMSIMEPYFDLTIPMRCATKQRPRTLHRNGRTWSYMPKEYQQWRRDFLQAVLLALPPDFPTIAVPCHLSATLSFTHSATGDLDNYLGAILDSLQPHPLLNDRLVLSLSATTLHHHPANLIRLALAPLE